MAATIAPPPYQTSLVEPQRQPGGFLAYLITSIWVRWLLEALIPRVQSAPAVLIVVQLEDQNASIGTTALPTAALAAGQYRVSYYTRITTVGAVSSSLTITIGWTESAVSLSASGAALTSNLTTSIQTGTLMLEIDQAAPITYATTYSSNAAGQMRYRLTIVLERVN